MYRIISTLIILLNALSVQSMIITGKVTNGINGIEGVTVAIQNSDNSVQTNSNGEYELTEVATLLLLNNTTQKSSLAKTTHSITITASKDGYVSEIKVVPPSTTKLDFVLIKEGEETWVASLRPHDKSSSRRIAWTTSDGENSEITYLTDSEHNDYKPVISPNGKKIAFFRVTNGMDDVAENDVTLWKSKICVMNVDGTGFKELTNDDYFNCNLHWTRDGSNMISWTRIINEPGTPNTHTWMGICWTSQDASPGDEVVLSDQPFEFGYSFLRDGRKLLRRHPSLYYLMTPNPEGSPSYERIEYMHDNMYLHKMTISQDETKISYIRLTEEELNATGEYMAGIICHADFDASIPKISNEIEITAYDINSISWYSSYSKDDSKIIYAHNGTIRMYDITSGNTTQISTEPAIEYRYPNYISSVK